MEASMNSVVGVFKSRVEAELAAREIHAAGVPSSRIDLLSPGETPAEVEGSVPTSDAEQPGIGTGLGAVVGGTIGVAGGIVLGDVLATVLLPGIGLVAAVGATAAAILGALGAVGGGAVGRAADKAASADGIPGDELFVYEDALRQGRSVLIAQAEDDAQAATMRKILEAGGAETVDKARHMWWIGVRDAEKAKYNGAGGNFDHDEDDYRRGFEAALHVERRGKSFEDARDQLEWLYPDAVGHAAFRDGFERGREYLSGRTELRRATGAGLK
jgi:hypothetical protein